MRMCRQHCTGMVEHTLQRPPQVFYRGGQEFTLQAEECFSKASIREQLSDVNCKARTALTFA